MKMSMEERNVALNLVNTLLKMGLSEYFHSDKASNDLYDWFRENNLANMGFEYFSGATKCVLTHEEFDWVIKFRYPGEKKDYCAKEYENYIAAEKAGFAYYFAACDYLCQHDDINFYVQERVECTEDVDSVIYENLLLEYKEEGSEYDEDNIWYEVEDMESHDRMVALYGNHDLADFVENHRINDLHNGNFGVIGDHYVMIDYSGFGYRVWEEKNND